MADMKTEFEAWARDNRYVLDLCGEDSRVGAAEDYVNTTTAHAWDVWQAARSAVSTEASAAEVGNGWVGISDRLPPFDQGERVLIYTEGFDFGGEQFFDIKADDLLEIDPDNKNEVAAAASHWMPLPRPAAPVLAQGVPSAAPGDPVWPEIYCPCCKGSGEGTMLVGGGPDASDEPCDCQGCNGTGVVRVVAATAPGGGEPSAPKLAHGHRDDYFVLANARRLISQPVQTIRRMPNWVLAQEVFATGSGSARQICLDAGIDPDGITVERVAASHTQPPHEGQ